MRNQEWRNGFLLSLQQLGCLEGQKEKWLKLKDDWFPCPAELLCQVFDDSGIDEMLKRGIIFSEKIDRELNKLSELANSVNTDHPVETLLSDKHWLELVQ
jgi:hypothetical protein